MKASHASTLALRRCQSTGSPISLTFLQGKSRFVQGTEPSPRAIGPQSEVHGGWITLASLTASQMTLVVSLNQCPLRNLMELFGSSERRHSEV